MEYLLFSPVYAVSVQGSSDFLAVYPPAPVELSLYPFITGFSPL